MIARASAPALYRFFLLGLGLIALFQIAATCAHAQSYPPRNQCSALDGADRFMMTLTTAVANRDADMLEPLVDRQVLLDFGGSTGWPEMRLRLDQREYDLWHELDELLLLGCAADAPDSMWLPDYWRRDIDADDPYDAYLVMGSNVPLYTSTDGPDAKRELSWELVDLIASGHTVDGDDGVTRSDVQLGDGTRGFIDSKALRSLIDYRLEVARRDGRWLIVTFVAGD